MIKKQATRILGIDYGMVRIGLAISDESKIIAMPITVLRTEKRLEQTAKKLAQEIKQLQEKYECEIEEIALGIPLHMNGQMGIMADEVKLFAQTLKTMVPCEIILRDERLTSVQADRALRQSSMTRKKRAKLIDQTSAAIILQSYLDYKAISHER